MVLFAGYLRRWQWAKKWSKLGMILLAISIIGVWSCLKSGDSWPSLPLFAPTAKGARHTLFLVKLLYASCCKAYSLGWVWRCRCVNLRAFRHIEVVGESYRPLAK